ncbi:MAG: sortase [Anaerolineales bacterium]|nr:sortase [Anaerolineales bacterium]
MNRFFRVVFLLAIVFGNLLVMPVTPVRAASLPAEINKQFTPLQIDAGGISVLRVTIFNPNTFELTNAGWTDNLIGVQPGLFIANPANVVNTCGLVGDVTAVPGTTTLALSNGTVQAQQGANPGECYVEVNVSSVTPGNLINTIPANNLTSQGDDGGTIVNISNTTPASATITVIAVTPPSLSKLFVPTTIFSGETSQLTIRINNNDTDTNLTGASYTDTLPAGLQIANPNGLTVTNCGAGASVSAPANGNTITLTNGTITPAQDCLVQVDVTGASGAYLIANGTANTIPAGPGGPGSLRTTQGVTNGSPAQAELTIQPVGIAKSFAPGTVDAGDQTTLTITLQNPTGSAYTGVAISDNLNTMGAGYTIAGAPTANTCGFTTINAPLGGTLIQLSGGSIPASATPPTPRGTCVFSIPVQTPLNSTGGTVTNTIPANVLTADQPVTNFLPATANLTVNRALTGTKAYSPLSIVVGGTSTVTITLNNASSTALTGVNFTDNLPPNLTVSGTPSSPQCGGTITNTTTSVTLIGGTIPANGNCTVVFNVTSNTAGTYDNAVLANTITNAQGVGHALFRTNPDLVVVNSSSLPVGLTKTFQTDPIAPGQFSRLRITITAPADTSISGINVTDTLPAGLVIAPYPPALAPTDDCPGGTITAVAGTNVITFTNTPADVLAAGVGCNIDVRVTSTIPNLYTNTIPANTVVTTEGRSNLNPAVDTIRVTSLTMSKAFYPTHVQAGGRSTLTITLQNTTSSPIVNLSMTDNLPGSPTDGIRVAAVPNIVNTCGGTPSAVAGSNLISITGGTIPAQVAGVPGLCTISVDVVGLDSTPVDPSTQTNTIPVANVNGIVQSTGTAISPFGQAQATLNIQSLSIGVVKGFNPVLVYGGAFSTMSVQLINPNLNTALTGITFTDDMTLLGVGIQLANPVNFDVGTCGGVLTGNPGDTSFTFTGGSLLANTSCTLTLRVVMNVNGNLTNRIPAGAVTTFNGVSNPDPTEASLTNLPGVSVSKTFNPAQVLTNQASVLTITIANTGNVPVVNMGLVDNLPGTLPDGLEVANPSNAFTDCGGLLTALPGSQTVQLTGGGLTALGNPGDSCLIRVDVISTRPGVYINTIPAGRLTADGGITNNNPANATLTVASNYSLGNRVWYDTNNNGQIDFGTEQGISNVRVQLFNAAGAEIPVGPDGILGTGDDGPGGVLTNANGYYRFDNLPAGDYIVRIPNDNFTVGGTTDALVGYWSSGTTINASGIPSDSTSNDPDTDADDSDENGITNLSGNSTNYVQSAVVTLGPDGTEPVGETDLSGGQGAPDGNANMTVDFGFYRQTLGDLVFVDINGDGDYDAGTDSPLSGALVQLFSSDGTEIITGADGIRGTGDDGFGPDGIPATGDDGTGGVLTGAPGTYQFAGLPEGDYIVRVTPPAGYASTVDTSSPADTTDPDTNTDNNDNGAGTGTGQVSSGVVTLTPGQGTGGSPGAANNVVNQSSGTTLDPTVDFGFTTTSFSLGNRVWFDTNNNGQIDFGTESGISGVRVELYQDNGDGVFGAGDTFLSFDTTDAGGYYRFDNLPAGNYVVVIPADNFRDVGGGDTVASDPLAGYWSSGTTINTSGAISDSTANDPDTTPTDSDDNGISSISGTSVGYVAAAAVTLGPLADEPLNETDLSGGQGAADGRANMTVDFGFYRQQLGDQVFVDVNRNGTYDAGDTPLAGATVQLYSSDGTEMETGPDGILGTSDDGPGGVTTGAGGTYQFSGLPQGDYIVRVTPPVGYTSTVDTANSGDTTNPNDNINNNDNGIGGGVGQVSSNPVTLTPGSVGAANNNTVNNASGTTSNPTVDFGFIGNSGSFTKTLTGTNETFTTDPQVAIGEILTYEILVNLPIGTPLDNVTVTDQMDKGLAFVDCLFVEVAGVDQTATICPPPPPTPPAQPVVSSITNPGDSPANPANPGRQVVFTVGNIPTQTSATTLLIRYRAIVLDVIENQDGVTLNNNVTWAFTGGSFTTSAPDVEVIEPDLAINKSAIPSSGVPIGTPIQFSITVNHSAISSTDAFDVVLTDILPPELEYIPCTVVYAGLAPTTPPAPAYCPAGTSNLVFQWDVFPLGSTATITFNARLVASPATNTANVAWTSLPIDPQPNGLPVQLSVHNARSTERWYDPLDDVDVYGVSASVVINQGGTGAGGGGRKVSDSDLPDKLPDTGFAPGVVTLLQKQPAEKAYRAAEVWLEIPRLGVKMPIVGVPLLDDKWDVTWLWNEAGWLEGTAFPSWSGNSVLTSHVTLPNGEDGPFASLGELKWGDRIIVHAYGVSYEYEVRQNRTVSPTNKSVLQHEDEPWLTLITCATYNESTGEYGKRIAIRAVLVGAEENASSIGSSKTR